MRTSGVRLDRSTRFLDSGPAVLAAALQGDAGSISDATEFACFATVGKPHSRVGFVGSGPGP